MLPARRTELRKRTLTDWMAVYLLLCLCYRLLFVIERGEAHSILESFNYAALALGFAEDILMGLVFLLPCYGLLKWRESTLLSYFINCLLIFILLSLAILFSVNQKLFLLLNIRLAYQSLMDVTANGFTVTHMLPFVTIRDYFLLSIVITAWLGIRFVSAQNVQKLLYFFLLPIMMLAITGGMLVFVKEGASLTNAPVSLVYANPLRFLLSDYYRASHNPYLKIPVWPNRAQLKSLQLIDPIFVKQQPSNMLGITTSKKKEWNVVLIVMESVGYDYVTPTTMPFLTSLAKKGLWLSNHYTSGNNSPIGAFGLFSGIYPSPLPNHAVIRHNIRIPNTATWLGKNYDSFFVTPADTRMYFPEGFFKQTGFNDFYNVLSLPLKEKKLHYYMYMDDLDAMAFFINRIEQARTPFFAAYWPCATHYPYVAYSIPGSSPQPEANAYERYLHNLRVLDYQLARIYEKLKQKHLLDKTILIVTSDHGEGFGQHSGAASWLHGGALDQEQIKIPTLFYQPALFAARRVTVPTSLVDVLPTLLDALNKPYHQSLLQGESLLRKELRRKFVFVYGAEDAIAAIDQHDMKTEVSFADGTCKRFDLRNDPLETQRLNCAKEMISTISKFRYYQSYIFESYNNSLLARQATLAEN